MFAHSILDEAKHFWQSNLELVDRHLSDFIKSELTKHEIEYPIEPIKDTFGPITASSPAVRYLRVPESLQVLEVNAEDKIHLIDLLAPSETEPLGIDCEWRPSMNIFHVTQGPSILQVSDSQTCLIIDLITLRNSKELCSKLKHLFKTRLIVGFGF